MNLNLNEFGKKTNYAIRMRGDQCCYMVMSISVMAFVSSFIFFALIFVTHTIPAGFNSYVSIPLFPIENDPFGKLYTGTPYLKDGNYYVSSKLDSPSA